MPLRPIIGGQGFYNYTPPAVTPSADTLFAVLTAGNTAGNLAATNFASLGFQDTNNAGTFNVTQLFTSTTQISAARTVIWDVNNTSQVLKFTAASTVTFPAGTNTLIGSAVANTISTAGAASAPALTLSGAPFTGGTGTTTFPLLYLNNGTAPTTFSTSGTIIGINAPNAFAGDSIAYFLNGTKYGSMSMVSGQGLVLTASIGVLRFVHSSTIVLELSANAALGAYLQNDLPLGFATGTNNPDLLIRRKAAATLQMGSDAAGVTNQMFTAANRITSDGVGADLTIAAGNGLGGAGGSLILSTFTTAATGVAGTLTARLTIDTAGLATWTGQQSIPVGSAANPSIFFTGDTNTGIFWVTSDFVGIAAGGVECMRIGSNYIQADKEFFFSGGNSGFSESANVVIQKNAGVAQTFRIYGTTTGPKYLNLGHNGTDAFVNTNSGSLLISSLPTANPGPGILWNNAGTPAIGT